MKQVKSNLHYYLSQVVFTCFVTFFAGTNTPEPVVPNIIFDKFLVFCSYKLFSPEQVLETFLLDITHGRELYLFPIRSDIQSLSKLLRLAGCQGRDVFPDFPVSRFRRLIQVLRGIIKNPIMTEHTRIEVGELKPHSYRLTSKRRKCQGILIYVVMHLVVWKRFDAVTVLKEPNRVIQD